MSNNITQDQNNTGKSSVRVAGSNLPKKVYSFRQINDMLTQKIDKDGTYKIQSMDEAMEMIPAKTAYETEAFQKERWELVKSIFYCFHSTTTGMPKSLRDEYMPVWNEKKFLTQAYAELEKGNRNHIPARTIDF